MAEIAVGVIAAEQVISTGLEAAAAVAVVRPTKPPKATLSQIAKTWSDDAGLARAHHTVTAVAGGTKACIFGGEQTDGQLCAIDVHVISLPCDHSDTGPAYQCFPAFPLNDPDIGHDYLPAPRARHAAAARGKFLVVHGGHGAGSHEPLDEDACLWLWDSEHLSWARVRGETQLGRALAPRFGHHLFVDAAQDFVLLHGGRTGAGAAPSSETWMHNFDTLAWTELPKAPAAPLDAAYVDNTLYAVGRGESQMNGVVHYLRVGKSETERMRPGSLVWQTVDFPANPLAPGPKPRVGGALVPVDLGMGRKFLLLFFGRAVGKDEEEAAYYPDVWALQLPTHGVSAASAKDAIRDKVPGLESGEFSWAEVEIVPTEQTEPEGKAHPGPRACFGADACLDGKAVILWGGLDGKSEKQADGWLLKVV